MCVYGKKNVNSYHHLFQIQNLSYITAPLNIKSSLSLNLSEILLVFLDAISEWVWHVDVHSYYFSQSHSHMSGYVLQDSNPVPRIQSNSWSWYRKPKIRVPHIMSFIIRMFSYVVPNSSPVVQHDFYLVNSFKDEREIEQTRYLGKILCPNAQ